MQNTNNERNLNALVYYRAKYTFDANIRNPPLEKPAGAEKSAGVDKLTGVDKSAGMDNVKESESRAEIFNSFIMNAGLDEVPLGGSAFTWCHKSASKISKLDRFLVSENLWALYPNISAITLDNSHRIDLPSFTSESCNMNYWALPVSILSLLVGN
ncbi:hypothetical protein Tco_0524885 [Tanacetum coccineum]